jgi:hypothetical protein
MGWLWRQAGAHLYRGNNMHQGSRSIHRRSHNEEKPNASKNYGIAERKDLEDMKELTTHEKTDRWASRHRGGAS